VPDDDVGKDAADRKDRVERRDCEAPDVAVPCGEVYRRVSVEVCVPFRGDLRRG
jgi:hypothetical protein